MMEIQGAHTAVQLPIVVIESSRNWLSLGLRDLWDYRELVYFLVWRDIKVRYKQTALGAAWAVIQPFLTMVVFSVVFGRIVDIPSDGVPYPIFAFCALLPWQLFANALTQAGNSVLQNQELITKVYFPRLVIPVSAVLACLVDFAIAFMVLLGMMFYYGIVPTAVTLTLPLFVLLAIVAALGAGLWLSALNVWYRDVKHTIPFLVQIGLFATPVAYPSSLVPEAWRVWFGLNPMAGVVEGFRWALLGSGTQPGSLLVASSIATLLLLVTGVLYFQRMQKTFADII